MFDSDKSMIETKEASKVISGISEDLGFVKSSANDVLLELEVAGLLTEPARNVLSFTHKSFLDFFVAKSISRDSAKIYRVMERFDGSQIVVLACELVEDIAPILDVAISQNKLLLAAQCISHGHTRNRGLIDHVASEFIDQLGTPFINLLVERKKSERTVDLSAASIALIEQWESFQRSQLSSYQKGKLFEQFAADFFGKLFRVVQKNLNTENGELDFIIEFTKSDPFWMEFGGDAPVECKNWATNTPLKDVAAFAYKASRARIKLAFIVSVSGFTSDALRTLRNNASDSTAPLIVPITGEDLRRALDEPDDFEEFFKKQIRAMKYLRE